MPNSTRNLTTIRSYADAAKLFTKPAPKGKTWSDNERPLGSNAQHHYRVARNHDGSYSVILYYTTMAQYYQPDADGSYRIDLTWDSRSTSGQFCSNVLWQNQMETVNTSCGRNVWRVIHYGASNHYVHDAQGRLVLEHSHQEHVKVIRANPRLAAWRKEAKARMAPLTDLFELRVAEVAREAENATAPIYKTTRAFKPNEAVEIALRELRHFDPVFNDWTEAVDDLRDLYDACIVGLVESRKDKAEPAYHPWKETTKGAPYKAPTAKACTTAFYGHLSKLSRHPKLVRTPTEMWPDADSLSASSISKF